jgi:transposase
MTRHRFHRGAFKRQVAEEFIAGETLHALSKRHDISRQLIRVWIGKSRPAPWLRTCKRLT